MLKKLLVAYNSAYENEKCNQLSPNLVAWLGSIYVFKYIGSVALLRHFQKCNF